MIYQPPLFLSSLDEADKLSILQASCIILKGEVYKCHCGNCGDRIIISFWDRGLIRLHMKQFKQQLAVIIIAQFGTFTEFSLATGISSPAISRLLNSNRMPQANTLFTFAIALGIEQLIIEDHE